MRTVVHLDMDCFYAQVEAVRLGIDCRTTPYALIQWGNLIAVNYPARDGGIRRFHDTATTAREKMPELLTSHIATYRMGDAAIVYPDNPPPRIATHKVALEVYRTASRKIFSILRRHEGVTVGKAGIDEAYLDVTEAARRELAALRAAAHSELGVADVMEPSTKLIEDRRAEMTAWLMSQGASLESAYDGPMRALKRGVAGEAACALEGSRSYSVVPHSGTACAVDAPLTPAEATELAENSLLLCAASRVVRRIRSAIYEELHYDCSAGIAHNRLLAKCISATHKPNQQTLLLPDRAASALFDLPLSKLRGFGGKFGKAVQAVCGGASLCREAWLVPLTRMTPLDSVALNAAALEDEGGEESGELPPQNNEKRVSAIPLSTYTYFRLRGLGDDGVTDPAAPHYINSSKIFHGFSTTLADTQQWLIVLSSELAARYADYAKPYLTAGRYLITRLHVRQGERGSRVFKHQSPISETEPVDEKEILSVCSKDAVTIGEAIKKEYGVTPEDSSVPSKRIPSLRAIDISLGGLRLKGSKEGDGLVSESQPTLLSLFSTMAATSRLRRRSRTPLEQKDTIQHVEEEEEEEEDDCIVLEAEHPALPPPPISTSSDFHTQDNKKRKSGSQPTLFDLMKKASRGDDAPPRKLPCMERGSVVSFTGSPNTFVISSNEDEDGE